VTDQPLEDRDDAPEKPDEPEVEQDDAGDSDGEESLPDE
jgi:hypothetical protein